MIPTTTRMRMLGALASALNRVPASAKLLISTAQTAISEQQRAAAAPKAPKLNRKQRRRQQALAKKAARYSAGWPRPK